MREICLSDGKGTHPALGFPLINMGDETLTPSPGDKGDMAPACGKLPPGREKKKRPTLREFPLLRVDIALCLGSAGLMGESEYLPTGSSYSDQGDSPCLRGFPV